MKFEHTDVYNFENAFRGLRNPKNSWNKSDSLFGIVNIDQEMDNAAAEIAFKWYSIKDNNKCLDQYNNKLLDNGILQYANPYASVAFIGPNDMKLAQTLIKAGPEHRKFLRQIFVSVDITAPLYWC